MLRVLNPETEQFSRGIESWNEWVEIDSEWLKTSNWIERSVDKRAGETCADHDQLCYVNWRRNSFNLHQKLNINNSTAIGRIT